MKDIDYLKKYYKGNIDDAIKRLEMGEPVQYIVGDVDFYGYTFKVDKRVLIPRFETEGLVEIALSYLKDGDSIIDLGTGSGCIAITLKSKLPNSSIDAVDISSDALDVAKINAELNNVDINFYQGDMLCTNKKYDCIISNPPYIAYDEEIDLVVKNNEPHIALYADNDGMAYYLEIFKNANNYLKDKFIMAFEIGYMQGNKLKEEANKYFSDCSINIEKDLSGKDRFLFIIKR